MNKRALVLSGGFMHGAFQVGVLKHLLFDLKTHYDIVTGISVGAVNGAHITQFVKGDEAKAWKTLHELWMTKLSSNRSIYRLWHYGLLSYLPALWKPSIYNSQPFRDILNEYLDPELVRTSGKELRVGAVCVETGEYKEWGDDAPELLRLAVEASAAWPAVLTPVRIGEHLWLDGGVHNTVPLKSAIDLGATEIDIVLTQTLKPTTISNKNPKALTIAAQAFSHQGDEVIRGDLNLMEWINKSVCEGTTSPNLKYINFRVFKPDEVLSENAFKVDPENIRKQVEVGYDKGIEVCWGIK